MEGKGRRKGGWRGKYQKKEKEYVEMEKERKKAERLKGDSTASCGI